MKVLNPLHLICGISLDGRDGVPGSVHQHKPRLYNLLTLEFHPACLTLKKFGTGLAHRVRVRGEEYRSFCYCPRQSQCMVRDAQ